MLQRDDWEDAVYAAEDAGEIDAPTVHFALRLTRVITWGENPGLYWNGEGLWDALKCSRATFFRRRATLIQAGLAVLVGGNLVPTSLTDETLSLTDETAGLTDETLSLTDETDRLTGETNMHACLPAASEQAQPKPTSLRLTAETTGAEIRSAYPGEDRFPEAMAATFVVRCLQQWPDAQRPRFTSLARLFRRALQHHSAALIGQAAADWLNENADSTSMTSPAAVFSRQSAEIFAQYQPAPKEAAAP